MLGFLLSLIVSAFSVQAAMFSDVSADYPYTAAIEELRRQEVFMGYPDGRFFPFQTITRIELVHSLVKSLFSTSVIEDCDTNAITQFTDLDYNEWYGKTVCTAQTYAIVTGYNDGVFKPDIAVNFAEAATILARSFEVLRTVHHVPEDTVWYRPFIKDLSAIRAIPLSIVGPHALVSRGEIAEMMFRLQKYVLQGSVGNVQYLLFEEMDTAGEWTGYSDPNKTFRLKYPGSWPDPYFINRPEYNSTRPAVESLWQLHIGPEEPCKARARCINRTYQLKRFDIQLLDRIAEELDTPNVTIIADVQNDTRNMLLYEEKTSVCTHRNALFKGRNYLYWLHAECGGTLTTRARVLQRMIESFVIDESRQRLHNKR